MTGTFLSAGLLAFAALQASAQEAAKPLEFEAASIKPFEPYEIPGRPGVKYAGGRMCAAPDPGMLVCDGTSLRGLVAGAYGLPVFRVFGPDWLDSAKFQINARIPHGATGEQVNQMLRKLLADRFHMTVHRETRELPGYTLTVDKDGPKLKEFQGPAAPAEGEKRPTLAEATAAYEKGAPMAGFMRDGHSSASGQATLEAYGFKMPQLADHLAFKMRQNVVDRTDLKGEYEIHLHYAPGDWMPRQVMTYAGEDGVPRPVESSDTPSGGPTIFAALQSQLGLKLEMRKVPTETIVVDSSERTPTAN